MKIRAFVLDDDEAIRSLISYILEERGYEVLSYSEPLFCPVYLDSKCPCPMKYVCGDIFITDINMPNITGLEFLENQMRNDCKATVQNMAVMSGAWTDTQLEQAKKLGCRIFEKPLNFEEVSKWLDECEKRIEPDRKLINLQELFK
jgi:CheY-like chemotaxis protein